MNTRTEQGAIVWAISLVFVPYVAVPAYWFLGRSTFEGYVTARRFSEDVSEEQFASMRDRVSPYLLRSEKMDPAVRAAQALADQPRGGLSFATAPAEPWFREIHDAQFKACSAIAIEGVGICPGYDPFFPFPANAKAVGWI